MDANTNPLETLKWINKMIPKLQRKQADSITINTVFDTKEKQTILKQKLKKEELLKKQEQDNQVQQKCKYDQHHSHHNNPEEDDDEEEEIDDDNYIAINPINKLDEIDVDQILGKDAILRDEGYKENSFYKTKDSQFFFPLESFDPQYSEEHLEFLQFHYVQELNDIFFRDQTKNLNKIRCISVSKLKIAVAGNLGNVLVYDKISKQQQIFRTAGSYGMITTIDVFENLMVIGFERGQLTFIDVKSGEYMHNDQNIHKDKKLLITKIVYKDHDKYMILGSDQSGYIVQTKFHKKLFGFKAQGTPLFPKLELPISNIEVLSSDLQQKYLSKAHVMDDVVVAIGNTQKIMVLGLNYHSENPVLYHTIQNTHFSIIGSKEFFCSLGWGEGFRSVDGETSKSNLDFLQSEGQLQEEQDEEINILETKGEHEEQDWDQEDSKESDKKGPKKQLDLQLILSFNNEIYMLQPIWREEELYINEEVQYRLHLEFEESRTIKCENNILSSNFISSNIVSLIDLQQNVTLFNVKDAGFFNSKRQKDIKKVPHITHKISLKDPIFCQLFEVETSDRSAYNKLQNNEHFDQLDEETQQRILRQRVKNVQLYSNSFSNYPQNHEVYYLCENRFGIMILNNWQVLINRMIEHGECILAMHFLISLYQNENKFMNLQGYTQKQVGEFIEESIKMVTMKYIQMSMKLVNNVKESELKKNIIVILIEFLLKTGQSHYLFHDIKDITTAYFEKVDYFMDSLEPFIRERKIKSVPTNKVLQEIIDYFLQKQQLHIIQSLIVSLELNNSNIEEFSCHLIQLSLDHGLIKALIYICTKEQNEEFMAPLSKFWGLYLNHQIKHNDFEAKFFGLRALWYVRLCLKRETIGGQILNSHSEKFKGIVHQLAEWTFYEVNLKQMIQLSPQATFEMLILFFDKENSQVLNGIQNLKISHEQDNMPTWVNIDNKSKCDEALLLIIKCFDLLLPEPSHIRNFKNEIENEFNLFLAKLILLGGFQIQKCKIIQTTIFLLQHPQAMKALKLNEERIKYADWENKEEVSQCLMSKFIDSLIKKTEYDWTEEEKNRLTQVADESQFTEISIVMWAKKKDFKKCIELFMHSKNKLVREKVFSWLRQLMAEMESYQEYNRLRQIKELIVNNLTGLLGIHIEYTRDIISRFFKQEETQIVMQLNDYAYLQLEYIEKILMDREEQKEIPDVILNKHIELLCQKRPKQIKKELSEWNYPQDQALDYCKQYGVMDAEAFLLEKNGQIEDSLKVHINILEKSLKKLYRYLTETDFKQSKIDKYYPKQEKQPTQLETPQKNALDESQDLTDSGFKLQTSDSISSTKESTQTQIPNGVIMSESQILKEKKEKEEELRKSKQFHENQLTMQKMNLFVSSQQDLDSMDNSTNLTAASKPNRELDSLSQESFYIKKMERKIFNQVETAIYTCEKKYKENLTLLGEQNEKMDDSLDQIWFQYFDDVLKLQALHIEKDKEEQQPLAQIFKNITGMLIYEISKNISVENLIKAFEERYSGLDLGELKATFYSIIADYQHKENLLDHAYELIMNDLVIEENQYWEQSQKGVFSTNECAMCFTNKPDIKKYVHYCGHLICENCSVPPQQYSNVTNMKLACPICKNVKNKVFWNVALNSRKNQNKLTTQNRKEAKEANKGQSLILVKDDSFQKNNIQNVQKKLNKLDHIKKTILNNSEFQMTVKRNSEKYHKQNPKYKQAMKITHFENKYSGKLHYQVPERKKIF